MKKLVYFCTEYRDLWTLSGLKKLYNEEGYKDYTSRMAGSMPIHQWRNVDARY